MSQSKIALITGGATGIGKATALKMIQDGITVILCGRREDVGMMAVKEIRDLTQKSAQIDFLKADVKHENEVKSLVDGIVARHGRLDIAVNNAAIANETASLNNSVSSLYQEMVDVNINGVYFCMKHQIIQMLQQGSGAIVNLASIAGMNGIPWAGPYASTKHAVVGLTKSAALDHAQQGIRINAVAPGAIKTEILAKQLEGNDPNYNEDTISALHPMNRMGRPDEIANGICWLASDEASFVTGHILNIDGGFQAK